MSAAVTRRTALRGSALAALGLGIGAAAVQAAPVADAALIEAADALKALRSRELQAWGALDGDPEDDDPAFVACCGLSADVCTAGEALAEIPAETPAGLAAKASAMLALVDFRKWASWAVGEALMEHHTLIVSVLRDAARLGGGLHV